MKHDLFIRISKVYIVKHDTALKTLIGCRVAVLVVMFPRPHSSVLLCLPDLSVHLLCIDKRDISVIRLRLLIQHLEDTVRSGKCHDNRIELLADLVDRHIKALVKREETCKSAECQSANISKGQHTAHDRTHHIAQIPKLGVDGTEHVTKLVCIVSTLKKLLIQLIEARHALLLVAEHLDNLLSFHHFLDKTIYRTKRFLLRHEIPSGKSSRLLGDKEHDRHHDQCRDRQRYTQDDHADKNADNRDRTVQKLWHTLADHLPQSINIIRIS